MASFGSLKNAIFEREERKQQYQAHVRGLNAYDRHKKFMHDYVHFYGKNKSREENFPIKTDQDTLREGYRFIRSEEDDMDTSWEQKLVKRYYDKLFKEYCIADMTQYKSGKFICGNKHCDEKDGLASYEVNFSYFEAGENKQALVKLVTCERCSKKLHYKRNKEKEKLERMEQEMSKRKRPSDDSSDSEDAGSRTRRRKGKKASTSSRDPKADDKEDFDEYLEGMFP
ncbi:protein FRA10AC1 isoform X2 [Cucurbita moschata]|uniref:Protein FRA10AC1 isoform X2 n=1 Tax=Cucurbita moschata TaxID=3662 RepID=A0A6J1H9A7_CUCMO|nr:protein FRA10AC1 isoform X2 [Cucurbita moschata]